MYETADLTANMSCGPPDWPTGYCSWGYNYTSSTVNLTINGGWNYWWDGAVSKTSGGTIHHGWNGSQNPCHGFMTGSGNWYGHPADFGCGGYLSRFLQYVSGNQSYVQFDTCTYSRCGGLSPAPGSSLDPAPKLAAGTALFGTSGQRIILMPADRLALQRGTGSADGNARLISTRSTRNFYEVDKASGGSCYAVGPASVMSYRLGQFECSSGFPSATQPILDFTWFRTVNKQGASQMIRSEGFAADGIAEIAFQRPSGKVVGVTSVIDHMYSVRPAIKGRLARLIARDGGGNVVFEVTYVNETT